MNFNFFENYFKFSIKKKKVSNLEKYYNGKYKDMVISVDNIPIEDINSEIYSKLKQYFFIFNKDSDSTTFTNNLYRRTQFNFVKIITREDLLWIKYLYDKQDKLGDYEDYKNKVLQDYEANDLVYIQPIQWRTFLEFVKEIFDLNSLQLTSSISIDKTTERETILKLENILNQLSDKIANKQFNFKRYQSGYNNTKTNIILNTFKGLFLDSRNPEISIIRDKNNLI